MNRQRSLFLTGLLLFLASLPAAASRLTGISGGFSGSVPLKIYQLRELLYWTGVFFMAFGGFLGLFHKRLGIHIPVGLVAFGVIVFGLSFAF